MRKHIVVYMVMLAFVILLTSGFSSQKLGIVSPQLQATTSPTPLGLSTNVSATNFQPLNTPTVPDAIADLITFEMVGSSNVTLYGPYDSTTVSFALPPTWELVNGAQLNLVIGAFAADNSESNLSGQSLGSSIDVVFNDQFVTSIVLEEGTEHTYNIVIPPAALKPARADGRHVLYLFLNAAIDCDYDFHKTTVLISSKSQMYLPHGEKSIPLDLSLYPWPIYQNEAIFPTTASIVIPKDPSSSEIRAAMIVAAGLGRATGGKFKPKYITTDELSEAIRASDNIIFVGKPTQFVLLWKENWPAAINGSKITGPGIQDDDGVLQMVASPWNGTRVVIWAGGNTDNGVVKAAQALGTSLVRPITARNIAVVADTTNAFVGAVRTASLETPAERTFAELGYKVETAEGAGFHQIDYKFYVAPGLIPKDRPVIDLAFSSSSLLDFAGSGMVYYFNDVQIGSEQLDENTSTLVTRHVVIPSNLVQPGLNTFSVQATLTPLTQCSLASLNNLWLTIYPDSILTLNLETAPVTEAMMNDLSDYPGPMISHPDLDNVLFILASDGIHTWRAASTIAYDLGYRSGGPLFQFDVVYDNELTDTLKEAKDIIVIGLPENLPIIAALKDDLPIPFENGKNITLIQNENIVYRIPENIPLGYIELLPSPWSLGRSLIALLGSNGDGLSWVGDALTDPNQQIKLSGNFAVTNKNEIMTADTRTGLGLANLPPNIVPNLEPEVLMGTPFPGAITPPASESFLTRRDWIPYVAAFLLIIVLGILFWVFRSSKDNNNNNNFK